MRRRRSFALLVTAAWIASIATIAPAAMAQQRFERVSVSSSGVEGNANQPSDFARVSGSPLAPGDEIWVVAMTEAGDSAETPLRFTYQPNAGLRA